MHLDKAKTLKYGDKVRCPPDTGIMGYVGVVTFVGSIEYSNDKGEPFIWITVKKSPRRSSVWPSNRLEEV